MSTGALDKFKYDLQNTQTGSEGASLIGSAGLATVNPVYRDGTVGLLGDYGTVADILRGIEASLISISAGALTGAVILAPTSSVRNRIQPTNPAYIPLTIRGAASQSAALFLVENSAGSPLLTLGASGSLTIAGVISGSNLSGTNTGDQTITLTGDVTGSGTGSFATAIGTNKVTLSMMAQVATDSFLGRDTAGTGNVEVLSVATVKTLLNLTGTNSGDQTITLTGGVTGSGTGSFAATVVTNANLTGPITSVGNATSVASQTGTGSTFVMSASPTLTGTVAAADATLSGNLTLSSIATGRIPYTTTAGLLTSGTGLTYNGSAFSVTGTADISGIATFASDIVMSTTDFTIRANTSDGADNKRLNLMGGGAGSGSRGGKIQIAGNEHGDAGTVTINPGLTATAYIDIIVNDNMVDAFKLREGANNYITLNTTNSSESIGLIKNVLASGTLGVTGVISGPRINLNGATDASGFAVNSLGKGIAISGGEAFYSFGVGTPGSANFESMDLFSNGTNGIIRYNKGGTGSYRPILIQAGGGTAVTIATNQAVTLASSLSVAGTITGSSTLLISSRSAFAGATIQPYIGMRIGDSTISTQGSGAFQYGLIVDPKAGTDCANRFSSAYIYANAGTSSTAELNSLLIISASKDSGTVLNNIAINIQAQTIGTNNYAIKTSTGIIDVGDRIQRSISGEFLIQNTNSAGGSSGGVRLYTTSGDIKLEATGALQLTSATTGLAVTGATAITGTLSSTGNFSVNTNKFTVDATNGNTTILGALTVGSFTVSTLNVSGDFSVGTTSFTVNSSTGNSYIAGGLQVGGGTSYLNRVLTVGNGVNLQATGTQQYGLVVNPQSGTDATVGYTGIYVLAKSQVSTGTVIGIHIDNNSTSSTPTNNYGLKIENQTVGTNDWSIKTGTGLVDFGDNVKIAGTLDLTGALVSPLKKCYEGGITASTTQSQGQRPLTKDINIITTVANVNDVVTMPSAVPGRVIYIANNPTSGTNLLQIFPASGEEFYISGNTDGVNVPIYLQNFCAAEFFCGATGIWNVVAITFY